MIDRLGRDLIIARVERVVVEYQVAFQNVAVLQPEMTVGWTERAGRHPKQRSDVPSGRIHEQLFERKPWEARILPFAFSRTENQLGVTNRNLWIEIGSELNDSRGRIGITPSTRRVFAAGLADWYFEVPIIISSEGCWSTSAPRQPADVPFRARFLGPVAALALAPGTTGMRRIP